MLGSSGFGYGLASLELLGWNDRESLVTTFAIVLAVIAVFEVAVRYAGRGWPPQVVEEPSDYETITTLNLTTVPRHV